MRVIFWNVFLPVPPLIRSYGQDHRSQHVVKALEQVHSPLSEVDCIVLAELIAQPYQQTVRDQLHQLGFVHQTRSVTHSWSAVEGGVVIFSRHAILRTLSHVYTNCYGTDCLSAKGVVYAQLQLPQQAVHVFATHLHSWNDLSAQKARQQQVVELKQFMQQQKIPESDLTLLVGDFNLDLYHDHEKLEQVWRHLKVKPLPRHPDSLPLTMDPVRNPLYGADDPTHYRSIQYPHGCFEQYARDFRCHCCPAGWLDYIAVNLRYPDHQGFQRALRPQIQAYDLTLGEHTRSVKEASDHYPLLADIPLSRESLLRPGASEKHRQVAGSVQDKHDAGRYWEWSTWWWRILVGLGFVLWIWWAGASRRRVEANASTRTRRKQRGDQRERKKS